MTYTPRDACEFPNDNPNLHSGAAWVCLEPLAPARAVLRSSLLSQIQAELLTPARPRKTPANDARDPEPSHTNAGPSANSDDIVTRLIALVARLDPSVPPTPATSDVDLARESQRMLTELSSLKPSRVVDNVPAPPAHVYEAGATIAPPSDAPSEEEPVTRRDLPKPQPESQQLHEGETIYDADGHGELAPVTLRGAQLETALSVVRSNPAPEELTAEAVTTPDPSGAGSDVTAELDARWDLTTHDALDLELQWPVPEVSSPALAVEATPSLGHEPSTKDAAPRVQLDLGFDQALEAAQAEEPSVTEQRDWDAAISTAFAALTDIPTPAVVESATEQDRSAEPLFTAEQHDLNAAISTAFAALQPLHSESVVETPAIEPSAFTAEQHDDLNGAVSMAFALLESSSASTSAERSPPAVEAHGFACFVEALVQVALGRGATRAAAIIPTLFTGSYLDAALFSDALLTQLTQADLVVLHDGSFRVTESFSSAAQAWRNLLDGNSDDFGACETTLDEWGTSLLVTLLATQGTASELKRDLRRRGVAAFGMRVAA